MESGTRDDCYLRDEDFLGGFKLDLSCSSCAEDFKEGDEVILVKIVRGQQVPEPAAPYGTRVEAYDEIDDEGDFRYEPYFMHYSCWELLAEEYSEKIEDLPPIWEDDTNQLVFCQFCRNSIRAWEVFGLLMFGVVKASLRSPNGKAGSISFKLVEDADQEEICLSCLRGICEESLELWDDLSQMGECKDCSHIRCWRPEYNPCKCRCGHEGV